MFRMLAPAPAPSGIGRRTAARIAAVAGAFVIASVPGLVALPGHLTAVAKADNCNQRYCGDMPEWYQYCLDRTPTQHMTGAQSQSPQYFYKTGIATPSGVDCKYMHATFFGMWPVESTVHYSWQQVCRDLRIGNNAVWDGRYPHCRR